MTTPDKLPALPEPIGWWVKYADGSEELLTRLPTDPDVEDMPSRATPLHTADQLRAYGLACAGVGVPSEFAIECLARYLCQRDGDDPDEVAEWIAGIPEFPCWHNERDVARGILYSAMLPAPPAAGEEQK